jgi:hypothetical protein
LAGLIALKEKGECEVRWQDLMQFAHETALCTYLDMTRYIGKRVKGISLAAPKPPIESGYFRHLGEASVEVRNALNEMFKSVGSGDELQEWLSKHPDWRVLRERVLREGLRPDLDREQRAWKRHNVASDIVGQLNGGHVKFLDVNREGFRAEVPEWTFSASPHVKRGDKLDVKVDDKLVNATVKWTDNKTFRIGAQVGSNAVDTWRGIAEALKERVKKSRAKMKAHASGEKQPPEP